MSQRFEVIELRTRDHAVRDRETGEVMHPSVGPWNEANLLYVGQSGLTRRLSEANPEPLHLWDVGLGAGTNAVAALTTALQCERRRPLSITSFDTTTEALELALRERSAFPFMTPWQAAAESILRDGVWQEGGTLSWRLVLGDCARTSAEASPAQLVYFDPFSPESNPKLWTVAALSSLRTAAGHAEGTTLMTYSASTRTRVSLLMAGFFVGMGVAVGTRQETTVAATRLDLLASPLGRRFIERWQRSDARSPHGGDTVPELLSHPQFAG